MSLTQSYAMNENPLRRWLRLREMEAKDVALRLGVSASSLSRIMSGKTSADPDFLAAVTCVTGGNVTANDWIAWHGAMVRDSRQPRKKTAA